MPGSSGMDAAKRSVLLWGLLAAAVTTLPLSAAETGYQDDFAGAPRGWAASNAYAVAQQGGVLTLTVDKQTRWEGQYLDLGAEHDFSGSPYVNVRVKSDEPCILHVYLTDGNKSDLRERKVRVADDFVTLSYDFSDATNVDLKRVKGMIFTVNGAANSWTGKLTVADLRVGDRAKKLASIEAVAGRIHYHDTGPHTVLLTGLAGVSAVKVSSNDKLIRNVRVSPVTMGVTTRATPRLTGTAVLSYECVPGVAGSAIMPLKAEGAPGYTDNSVLFRVKVEGNLPPTIADVGDLTAQVGAHQTVSLEGISDGNVAAEQSLRITATSSDDAVVPGKAIRVLHSPGSPHGVLSLTADGRGTTRITLKVDDGAPGGVTEKTFTIRAVPGWNEAPVIEPVAAMTIFTDAGRQRVELKGIGDGDKGGQQLTISTVSSSDATIVPDPLVEYMGRRTAALWLAPNAAKTGTVTITVVVRDKGGTPDNNGDRQTEMSFDVTTRVRPQTAYHPDLSQWEELAPNWRTETGIQVSAQKLEGEDVLRIDMRDKVTFGGLWFRVPDLDLTAQPYLTVDVRPQHSLQFNTYFYDGNQRRNDGARRTTTIPANRWTTVTFDFSGEGQMSDGKGKPIRSDWVQQVLFNFHPKLGWPFSRYSGTLYFRNLRIGTAADIPQRRPVCTVAPAPDRVHLRAAGRQQIVLTGLASGADARVSVSATSSRTAVIPAPTVGEVRPDGTAVLSYAIGGQPGRASIKVTVSSPGSQAASMSFDVDVLTQDAAAAPTITIDCSKTHQVIHGFGTFSNDVAPEVYGGDLGASAMRVGLIANQIEARNDNSDPNVLNRGALNYQAFDFDHYRALKEAGVETFILTVWSPPAWMKTNLSLNYQGPGSERNCDNTANRLDYYQYDEFAESMVAAVRMFEEEAGITLTAVGVQNEPAFHEPYPSAILDARRFVELIKVVGKRFEREGIKARLFMPEQVFSQVTSMRAYIDALNGDREAENYCDIVATHGYDPTGTKGASPEFPAWTRMWERAQRGTVPKEMWMTETYPGFRGWQSAFAYGLYLYGSLEYGNIGLWTSWSIEGQLINQGRPNAAFYVCSQFYRHIRPGAVRVASASTDGTVLATSYVNDERHGGKLVSILINNADRARAVRVDVRGRAAAAGWAVSRTDQVSRQADAGTAGRGELVLLPARSVTTISER